MVYFLSRFFSFSKWHLPVQEIGSISAPLPFFNLVYFDAFAPRNQPEMWEEPIFKLIFNNLESKGLLTTYCAKAIVKRTLLNAGFVVRKAKGPMRKREIILAEKP
jgi:tRNA U34 5-methylaminomethyl-2-thiouridine-forming methyltransferase MnmC